MAFTLKDLIAWSNSATSKRRPYLLWRSQRSPVIDKSTKSFKKGTLYQIRIEDCPENYSLVYCSKDFNGTFNWSSFKAVGDKGLHAYSDYSTSLGKSLSSTLSSIFYVVTKYTPDGDLPGPEGVTETDTFLISHVWELESDMDVESLASYGKGSIGYCKETGKFFTRTSKMMDGQEVFYLLEVGDLFPSIEVQAQAILIKKVYSSYEELEAGKNTLDVDLYELASVSADSLDGHEGEIYCKIPAGEGEVAEWQYVGQFNTKDYYEATASLLLEASNVLAETESRRNEAEEFTAQASLHRTKAEEADERAQEASLRAKNYEDNAAAIVESLGVSYDEAKALLEASLVPSTEIAELEEALDDAKEEFNGAVANDQYIYVPSVDTNGTIVWTKTLRSEAPAVVISGTVPTQDDLTAIREELDTKFGNAKVAENKLYFYASKDASDSDDICGPIEGIGGGGGGGTGGGSGGNNAILTVNNKTGWSTATIADGSNCMVSFVWSSIEEGFDTGPGTLSIKVNGVTYVAAASIQNGATIIRDISSYLTAGTKNKVVLTVADCYGNERTLRFTVQVIALKVTSTFDATETHDQAFDFRVTPTGDAAKVLHYVLDADYPTLKSNLANLNTKYKLVGKKPIAEEGVTYYALNDDGTYSVVTTLRPGVSLAAGYYIQNPITYTQCAEDEVAKRDITYYEFVEGEYRALERVVIGSPVDEYFTQDEITYTLLVEEDSLAEEDVTYYELLDNTYYVPVENIVVGETIVSEYYIDLYDFGGIDLNSYIVVVGEGEDSRAITLPGFSTTSNGTTLTQRIPEQTHGAHTLDVWFESVIESSKVASNLLHYEFAYLEAGHTEPILISSFYENEIEQYETIKIPYIVITPDAETTPEVNIYVNDLVEEGQEVYTTPFSTIYNADRSTHNFAYRADKIIEIGTGEEAIRENGRVQVRFKVGDSLLVRDYNITVIPCSIVVEAVKENLDFYLTSNCGKTNESAGFNEWGYNGINAQFSNFSWTSDGWQLDKEGYPVMRLMANARITIPFQPFEVDFGSSGETIEIEFSTSNIYNYDTPIISCWDELSQRGFIVTSQKFTFKTQLGQIITQFKEDEHVRISFVIDEKRGDRIIGCYINGIMSGAIQYAASNNFQQTLPQDITIGCSDATVDIYNIRFYNRGLTRNEVVTNWIADTFDGYTRKVRYEHNDIFDNGIITPETLPVDLPYMILSALDGVSTFNEGSPQFKGDKRQIHGEYHDLQNSEYSFEYNAEIDVQGSSSQFYPRKNYEIRMKKATTKYMKYLDKDVAESKQVYKLRGSSVATERFTFKADYASSEGANNVELTKLYNDLQKNILWKTPRQQKAESLGDTTDYRIGIDGYPMAVFWRAGSDLQFIGKYNFNNSKGTPEVYGFDFYEDDNNPTGYPIESWETLNNVSNRVVWKSDDYEGTAWANDFEARYMDEVPSYIPTQDTTVVEGKHYFYKDSLTGLYIHYGYAWNTVQMKFVAQGPTTPQASELPNLYEPLMDKGEQAEEVNTNTRALHRLATWLKSTDTGYILNTAMKPTTTPSYATSMDFRVKTVAEGANVCGLYVEDVDSMVLVGMTQPIMNDPTAIYARFDEETETFKAVDVVLGEEVTGLYLISGSEYIEQVATDTKAEADTTYYELVEGEYLEVEDIVVDETVVNDYYKGHVGTHQKNIILEAMAVAEPGVVYYEAYNFHGETFDTPITLTYPVYSWSSKNDGTYDKTYETQTFSEDGVEYRQAKFKTEFEDYFQKETTLFYYLFTEIFLMVDSRAKNAFATTWDGQHWSWVPYDMDTAIGINNEGALEFSYDLEDYMYIGENGEGITIPTPSSANVFNGAESVIWRNVRDCFFEEVAMLYGTLRRGITVGEGENARKYILSYEEVEKRFEDHQAKWPESLVNEDSYFKYIEPLLYEAQDYLEMLQGLKAEQRKWWLFNRFNYMDSKYFAGSAKDNTILFRAYNKGTFTVVPYTDIYAKGRFGNYIASARAPRNVPTSPAIGLEIVNDLESAIYSADQLKSVGDLSTFNPGYCNISAATRLQELKVGGGVDNTNFNNLTLGNNTLLRRITATHLPNLRMSVDAKGCTSLEEAYFEASGITELQLPDGGIVNTVHLPDTITRLEILNQVYITDFEVSSRTNNANVYRNISDLIINNASEAVYSELDEMISQMAPLSRVRLLNTPLHFEGQTASECWEAFEEFTESLSGMQGIDSNGNTTENAVVTGDVLLDRVVPSTFFTIADENTKYITMTDEGAQETAYVGLGEYSNYRFKYKEANDTVNWDYNNGSALETHTDVYHTWVGEESDWQKTPISAITPTTDAPSIEVPTRTSTSNHVEEGDVVDYAFEYAGWTREVVEGNVNGGNTYIVRGGEEVIEAENGESYSVVKDETFTAVYKAHPIYYVNFYDRADRNGNAETGASDARLAIEEGVSEVYAAPAIPEGPDSFRFELDYKEFSIYDGTNKDALLNGYYNYQVGQSSKSSTFSYDDDKDVLYQVFSRQQAFGRVITEDSVLSYIRLDGTLIMTKSRKVYEKSYVDGTYTEERLGEVPSITVPVTDPTDWRTNFNDNTIGQDEFERVQDYQYYFKGWTRNANTTIYNYGEDAPEDFFADGEALTVEGNTNFYAVYEKHAIYYADFYDVVGDTGNKLLYTACMIDGVDGESIGAYGGVTALTKAYNDHNHEHGDSVFGYTYYFDGFKEGKEKFIYDLHEGRIESEAEGTRTATLDIDGTVGVIHENKKFYTVYEARQTYYIAFFNDGVFMHEDSNVLGFESYTYTGSGTRTSVDNSHVRGDAQFGYNFYHRGWNDHNSDLTYDLTLTEDTTVDGRPVRSTACNEFTTTFSNLDGNRNFYEVYEAKQVYYLNFKSWNGEEFMGEEKSYEIGSLGNDSGIPTARVPFGTHVVDDDNSTYTFTFGGWSLTAVDSEDELTNNHTVAWPTTVTGYDYESGATNIVLNGNTVLYGMYQSHKTYYVSFHDHEGNLISAGTGAPYTTFVPSCEWWNGGYTVEGSTYNYRYEVPRVLLEQIAEDNSKTMSEGWTGWVNAYINSMQPSLMSKVVYSPSASVNYGYVNARPEYIHNWLTTTRTPYTIPTVLQELQVDDGIGVTWNGDASALARATTNNHATDSSAVDYQYEFIGWNTPTPDYARYIPKSGDSYINNPDKYIKLPDNLLIQSGSKYVSANLQVGTSSLSIRSNNSTSHWTLVEGNFGGLGQGLYAHSTSAINFSKITEVKNNFDKYLYVEFESTTTELNPTYSGSSVTYSAPSYYMHNVIGANTTSNIKLYATYQKRPIYYVNFYDWDNSAVGVGAIPYLEGGSTSTTSFDATSASASGSCVYTRTDIPMASATLSRANTEHHSLSDTSANDYNYTYYGWDTALRGTGDNTSAYRSESMASTVKAKTGTLGFVSANTNFYAVYEQKNIYYVDFYNTATPNYQPLTVDWGTGTGGVITYNAGEGLYIPKEFLQSGFNSSSCQPNADVLDGEVGYQTWFSSNDYEGTERNSPSNYYICVYKLPQNIGEYLYNNAETNTTAFYGEDDTAISGKKLWKGIAIYPDTCSSWSYVGGWGVGIRRKNEIKYIGRDSFDTLTPTSVVSSGDYANLENFSQWKALEDDAYYLVAQGSVKDMNQYTMTKWLSYFGDNRIYFRHWATYTQAPTSDTSTHGAKYTYVAPVAPFCAKGYTEGTSAGTLTSTTNVVRTLGTTDEPAKEQEELWRYQYKGWSTESNDCVYDGVYLDAVHSWEYSYTASIGTMNANLPLYAAFARCPIITVNFYNEGQLVKTQSAGTVNTSQYTSMSAPSSIMKANAINHEVGNNGTDTTYTLRGFAPERATGDEWTSSLTTVGTSFNIQLGSTAGTLDGALNDFYDSTTHVLTLHAVYETSMIVYVDFFEPKKVYSGASVTFEPDRTKPLASVGVDGVTGEIVSGSAPVYGIPEEDMYATYSRHQQMYTSGLVEEYSMWWYNHNGVWTWYNSTWSEESLYGYARNNSETIQAIACYDIHLKTYTINFYDSGDGTVDVSNSIGTVTSNYQATFAAPTPSGYVTLDQDVADMYEELLGWTTEPWDGVSQNVLSSLKCTGNMNLYAVYKNAYVGTRALVERNVTGDLQCSATSVGEYAFSDLDGLEYIDLTNATSIGAHAFENDYNLITVDIRTSACDIDPTAFEGCYSLEEIRVPVGSLAYYQTELGSLGVTITEHAWSDFEPNGWLGGTVEDVSGLSTPSYS